MLHPLPRPGKTSASVGPMFDVSALGLSDLVRLSAALRVTPPVETMEQAAAYVVSYLYENLLDKETGERSCALVRCYKTHPYAALEPDVRAFADSQLDPDAGRAGLRCLTLLATAGVEEAWNDRRRSVAHQAIPLSSAAAVERQPMLHALLVQLGVDIDALVDDPAGGRRLDRQPRTFDVFHVPEALGSPHVPAQDDFVAPYGIRSVVGFGGQLPDGEVFAVMLFSRAPISRETAEQFRTITGSVALALLPHTEGSAEWRAVALEQLLQIREVAILEQSLRIEQALADLEDRAAELARSRAVLAASEARKAAVVSASLDAVVTIGADGRIVEFNPAAERMFGYAADEAIGTSMAALLVPPRLRGAHLAGLARNLATGEARILGQRVEIDALRADGSELPVELTVSRIDIGEAPMFTATIRDLTHARRTEAELRELADTLQAGLLPPRPPRVPGVEVATHYRAGGEGMRVGGDFYDVFRLGADEWGVIIGDVCGKGAKAASVTALVRYTARAAAAHSSEPSDVMHEINAALADGPDADDRYCSAVFARLRLSPGRVDVRSCSGGHPSPLIVRADGSVEAVSPSGGQLVGLFEEYESSCEEFTLAAGDAVVLYTDGVSEARDSGGDLFGQERLAGLLAMNARATAHEMVAAVTRALQDWTDTPGDDVAIIALRPLG